MKSRNAWRVPRKESSVGTLHLGQSCGPLGWRFIRAIEDEEGLYGKGKEPEKAIVESTESRNDFQQSCGRKLDGYG